MKTKRELANFDPQRLAFYEKENYVADYRKRWLRLLVVSISMVKEAYQLSLPQAIYGAYLVARAEIAAAPFPDNDIPTAEAYIRRFYLFLKGIYPLHFDVEEAARQEVNWWVVHRRLFAQEQNQELVEAVARSYAVFFGTPVDRLMEAAAERARGMLYSDQWVRGGMEGHSPLLVREEEALRSAYRLLRSALAEEEVVHGRA
ncbi:MAG: hypothetical protein EHM39_06515 [Chloroflexi bacterium]|nr:MAG: hypothetical protein EHM39_06515 [Chloroflexota bacterium]